MEDKKLDMKKIRVVILLCLLSFMANAQQTYTYNYHLFDDYLLNPAYVGTHNYYSVLLGRDQRFYGLSSSPQSYFLSVHSRIGEGFIFDKDGKINKFFKKFGNIAVGFQFYQYAFGPERETNIGMTYGYHLNLSENVIRKNPRRIVLALTPRVQGMWFNSKDLKLISGDLNTGTYFNEGIFDGYDSYQTWIFTADVAALYQTVHADVGLGALNIIQTRNRLDSKFIYLSDTVRFNTYDSLYPTKFFVNAKLKFIDVYRDQKFDVFFIPKVAMLYYTKRNCTEYFADLKLESDFKKHIAGIRNEIIFVGELGLNINHKREYWPTTLLQPYVTFDFKNYKIMYAHSFYLSNDLVHSGAAIGGNQISIMFKIKNDRHVREQQYQEKFSGF